MSEYEAREVFQLMWDLFQKGEKEKAEKLFLKFIRSRRQPMIIGLESFTGNPDGRKPRRPSFKLVKRNV